MKAEPGVQYLALSREKPPCSAHGYADTTGRLSLVSAAALFKPGYLFLST